MTGIPHSDPVALVQAVLDSNRVLLIDQVRLHQRARVIQDRLRRQQPTDKLVRQLAADFGRAEQRGLRRAGFRPTVQLPSELPITAHREKILAALTKHQVVIVSGDTGSGKTTQLPKLAFLAGRGRLGRIGITQPRRLAAVSMARRVAEELHCPLGRSVGYQVRFDDRTTDETVIKFMTDGMLLAETISDRTFLQYDTLIIDEAHERSLNIDFVLGYLKNLLPRRRDLKVIVSSATLDVASFSEFFQAAPVLAIEGRTFPIEDVYLPPPDPDADLARQVAQGVQWVDDLDPAGDMLVFLPGEREIRDAAEVLRGKQYPNTEILPLFARLSLSDQQRVFASGSRRRIVLATNVAETSLTIPGIRYVIDSGLVRINRYRPRRQIQALQIEQVSQASARQRRGRCGRVANGLCVHLYSAETLAESPPFTDPEIRRASLAGVILQMAMLRLPAIEEFPFLNPPQRVVIEEGYRTLFEIGALDDQKNLTKLGRDLGEFPLDPQIARMIVQARQENVVSELLVLAALLSIQDPRDRPTEQVAAADQAHRQWQDERSDFHAALRLWNAWQAQRKKLPSASRLRRWCQDNYLSYRRLLEWHNLFHELADVVADLRWDVRITEKVHDDCFYDRVLRSVLAGFPLHIGRRGDLSEYQGTRDRQFYIFPGSGLFKKSPPWLVAFSLVETFKLYGRMVAAIDPEWIEQVAPHLCHSGYSEIAWSPERGFVVARESVTCSGLRIITGRRVYYGRIKPDVAREVFIREALVPGNLRSRGDWLKGHRALLETIHIWEHKIRRPNSLLDPQAIFEHFNRLVPATVCSTKDFDRWAHEQHPALALAMADAVYSSPTPLVPAAYPDQLQFRGHTFLLRYRFAPGDSDDGVVLRCPEKLLPALPAYAPDWLVPGWLPEKVRLLIRSLPKELRAACNPLQAVVDDFVQTAPTAALIPSLAAYLNTRFQLAVRPADFAAARLPEYLIMKIAVLDSHGKVRHLIHEKPTAAPEAMQVEPSSAWMPPDLYQTGLTAWPREPLPEFILLEEPVRGYPALVDEGATIGVRLFLDLELARSHHRDGLVRLFRIQQSALVANLERRIPLSVPVQLSLSVLGGEKQSALEDFVDLVIAAALRPAGSKPTQPKKGGGLIDDACPFEYPRDAATFHQRADAARTSLPTLAAELGSALAEMISARDEFIRKLTALRKAKPAATPAGLVLAEMLTDIERQLAFLFRPGFLRGEGAGQRYRHYFQALAVRLERLKLDPFKDRAKWEAIRPYQELLDAKLTGARSHPPPVLQRFAALLQEFRVSQFAPEIGTLERVSPKILQAFWANHIESH